MLAPYDDLSDKLEKDTFCPKRWSTYLVSSLCQHHLAWLLLGHPCLICGFFDHNNLRHIIHPHVTAKTLHLERLRRWATKQNILAVFLSRSGACDESFEVNAFNRVVRKQQGIDSALPWFSSERVSPLNPWYYG